jgi:hypothetical protein
MNFAANFSPYAAGQLTSKNKKAAENPFATRIFSRLLIKNHPTGLYQILSDEVVEPRGFEPLASTMRT